MCPVLIRGEALALSGGARSDILRIGVAESVDCGDPRFGRPDPEVFALEWLRFLPLVAPGEQGELRNLVAKKLISTDAVVWRVELRPGVRFASGRELGADDVVFTYSYFLSREAAGSLRTALFSNLAAVRSLSKYEVEFRLKEPQSDFAKRLTIGLLPVEARSVDQPSAVGQGFESGPYLGERLDGDELLFRRNTRFSAGVVGISAPKMERLRFRPRGNRQDLLGSLIKGEFDLVVGGLDSDDVIAFQKEPAFRRYRTVSTPGEKTLALALNVRHAVLQHPSVRSALQRAIDMDEMVRFSEYDLATRAEGFFLPGNPFYRKGAAAGRSNLKEARQFLDAAGFRDPDGEGPLPRFSLSLKTLATVRQIRTAKVIAVQLQPLGVAVEIEVLEQPAFARMVAEGGAALWLEEWNGLVDGGELEPILRSRGDYKSLMDKSGGNGDSLEGLLRDAKREPALAKRVDLYRRIQDRVSNDRPYILLWHSRLIDIVGNDVSGFRPSAATGYWPLLEAEKR
jgi:peptide/nickel transport system substrate-binding protein